MKITFSEELLKAIDSKEVVIDESRKSARVNNRCWLKSHNNLLWDIKWALGIRAELKEKGYFVV